MRFCRRTRKAAWCFFCGAGIFYPAGLPHFKGLVEQIYKLNGTTLSDIEHEAFERGQFDATLDLLERRLPGQRLAVRSKLAQALKPKLRRKGAIDTQAALLRLARSREGALRLVTTNFDRIFHVAAKRTGQQFATFLTYAALGPTEGYTIKEFRTAIGALSQEGLEESAQALSQALEGAADQREDYWRNRAQPFWQLIWPKSRDLATRRIAESLTRMVITARGEFPAALAAIQDWLQPMEHPHYVVHLLQESGLCTRYPVDALSLLDAVIADQQWAPRELGQCLDDIVQAAPDLRKIPDI